MATKRLIQEGREMGLGRDEEGKGEWEKEKKEKGRDEEGNEK